LCGAGIAFVFPFAGRASRPQMLRPQPILRPDLNVAARLRDPAACAGFVDRSRASQYFPWEKSRLARMSGLGPIGEKRA